MSTAPLTEAQRFRLALGSFTTGVTIVTTRDRAGRDVGVTANSFNSVSLDPPMVLWSLSRQALSLAAFIATEHFAVHVLASDQDVLSERFAARQADKFAGLQLERGHGAIPLILGCSARFQCRTVYRYEGGDHVILVGEVLHFDHSERPPLVFQGGRYAVAAKKAANRGTVEPPAAADSSFSRDFLIYLLGRAHFQQFLRLRSDLELHGLAEADWFVLNALSSTGERTLADLHAELADTGSTVTYDQIASLAVAGLLELDGGYDPAARVRLTGSGRQSMLELIAAAKAAEAHVEQSLGADEVRVLKQWLRIVVDSSGAAAPSHAGRIDE